MELSSDSKSDLKSMFSVAAILLVAFLVLFFYLYRNIQMATLRYEIKKLEKQERALYLEVEELRLKVARFSRAERIERLYRGKYGYLPVQLSQKIVTLELPNSTMQNE